MLFILIIYARPIYYLHLKEKENEAVKCEETERCSVEFIEALARVVDRSMMQAAKEKGITIDVYTDVIHRIGGYTEMWELFKYQTC